MLNTEVIDILNVSDEQKEDIVDSEQKEEVEEDEEEVSENEDNDNNSDFDTSSVQLFTPPNPFMLDDLSTILIHSHSITKMPTLICVYCFKCVKNITKDLNIKYNYIPNTNC